MRVIWKDEAYALEVETAEFEAQVKTCDAKHDEEKANMKEQKDEAAATVMNMRNGRVESPSSVAADTAIGTMMRAVAVLLTNWPIAAVRTNSPTSSR